MILLKKITLNDFLSHAHTEINFDSTEKALIYGASGSGKSSIFDAVIWALYGQGRADNRSLVRRGTKKASVTLELSRPEGGVTITRSVTAAGKHTLEVALQSPDGSTSAHPLSGIRELQNWIDKELVGASYLLFINSVAYVQGNTESFVVQTAPKRKELLLEIVKAEDYDKYYESARQTLSGVENEQNKVSGQVIELEARTTSLRAVVGGSERYMADVSEAEATIKDITPVIEKLEQDQAQFNEGQKTISVLDDALKAALSERTLLDGSIKAKESKILSIDVYREIVSHEAEVSGDKVAKVEKLTSLRSELSSASEIQSIHNAHAAKRPHIVDRTAETKQYEDQLNLFKSKPHCPSGDQCPYDSKNAESVRFVEKKIEDLVVLTASEQLNLANWAIEEAKLPKLVDMRSIMQQISDVEVEISSLDSRIKLIDSAKNSLLTLQAVQEELPSLKQALTDKDGYINSLQIRLAEAHALVQGVDTSLLQAKRIELRSMIDKVAAGKAGLETVAKAQQELKDLETRLGEIKSETLQNLQDKARKVSMAKDAFGSKGIQTLVIDYLLPKLEDRINEVLSKLSEFRVRLDTQRKSADGDSVVEGLFITILNESNEEMPFETYSGGEKLKISVAISEALATLQKVGFRLFDEVFLGLDENSTESFAQVLEGLQSGFGQVLCTSHLLQIQDLFDKRIVLNKNGGISYVNQS